VACGSRSGVGRGGVWVFCGRSWVWPVKGKAANEEVMSVWLRGSDPGGVGGLVSCNLELSILCRLVLLIDRHDKSMA